MEPTLGEKFQNCLAEIEDLSYDDIYTKALNYEKSTYRLGELERERDRLYYAMIGECLGTVQATHFPLVPIMVTMKQDTAALCVSLEKYSRSTEAQIVIFEGKQGYYYPALYDAQRTKKTVTCVRKGEVVGLFRQEMADEILNTKSVMRRLCQEEE